MYLQIETTDGALVSRIGPGHVIARVLARRFARMYRRPMHVRDMDADRIVYRAAA